MNRVKTYALGILLFFVGFTLLLAFVQEEVWNIGLTRLIQHLVPVWMDPGLSLFSLFGSFELQTALLVGVLVYFRVPRKFGIRILFFYCLGMGVEIIGKLLLFHPGPPKEFFRYSLPFVFESSHVQTGFSYPSGHTFRSVYCAVLALSWLYRKKAHQGRISATYIFVVVMVFSRVSLGEHWTTDVIGGVLLALGMGGLAISLLSSSKKTTSSWRPW